VIRNSVVVKLWMTIVGMVCIVLLLLSILLQQFFYSYVYNQQVRELTRLATSVQTLVQQNDLTLAENVGQQLADVTTNAHLQIQAPLTKDTALGRVYLGFSHADQDSLQSGHAVVIHGAPLGQATLSVYLLVTSPQLSGRGMVMVTQQLSVLDAPLTRMRNIIIFATVLGVLLTTGLAFVVSKNLSRPLIQMNKVAEEMAKGNFRQRVEVVTTDEAGRLGRTLNELANELERTIAALFVEKEQLSSILSSLIDGVIAADLQGKITLTNPPARRRLTAFYTMTSDEDDWSIDRLPTELMVMMDTVIQTNQTEVHEMTWQGRDIFATMTPLYESDGQTTRGVVCVFRDITEEKKLDHLRKDFIANVSHELRTPLSMMQGYTEALLDEFGDEPKQREEITNIIHDETLRMKRLVNDLLNLAQLESGQFHMSLQLVDLNQVVLRVSRKFQALAVDRKIEFAVEISGKRVPLVIADEDRMEQVCINLADNAIRHTSAGGRVTLTLTTGEHFVRLRVADTGSGIPQADLPYIWERFYKVDKARTRGNSGGTGLGLAITKHIILEHGGDIMVDSTEGQGTTFTISLPIATEETTDAGKISRKYSNDGMRGE